VSRSTALVEEVEGYARTPRRATAVTSRPENLPRAVAAIAAGWRGVHVATVRVLVETGEVYLVRDRRRGGEIVPELVLIARVVKARP
jgi:hypothetical protein